MKKDNLEAIYPLSPMQEGMLFHSLYAPQLEVYFEQFAYTLHGELDLPAFKHAWQRVIASHPILRTLFLWEGQDKPLQVVLRQVELPWSELDWRDIPVSEQARHLEDWMQADRQRSFDLSQAPVMRLTLIRLGEQSYQFLWSFHHLLLDGWSVYLVMGQVFSAYESLRQRQTVQLPASRPYRDYIGWLRQQDLAQAETFWRTTLGGFTTPTTLPIMRSQRRKVEPVGQYHYHRIYLSESTTTGLQQLARQQRLTLNTLVLGAWALLLSRYSGQEDVLFGTTVSGRPATLPGVEAMVGLFINTLPMRVRVESQQSLLPWLHSLQAWQVEARQYEYSPLVQVQSWSEVPRGQPLFENLLIFDNYPADTSVIEEMSLQFERMQVIERTNYPLTMSVIPFRQMMIRVSYAGTHFADESIQRLLGHLQTILEGMMANPQQRLADLPMLTEVERQQILFAWNATQTPLPQEPCLPTLFESRVEQSPEATALVFDDLHLTYGELNAHANQLAHFLRRLGVGPETCVGICLERSIAMIVSVLAVLKAGGAYVPLDPSYPAERLALMLHETQASVLLTQQTLSPTLQSSLLQESSLPLACQIIHLDHDRSSIAGESTYNPSCPIAPAHLAYIIYTSGSTGRPKGTLVEHRGLANLVTAQVRAFALTPESHVLQFASLSFDAAVSEIFTTLLRGATLFLLPKEALFPGPALVQRMDMQAISVVTLPPSLVMALPPAPLPALETLVVAGEAAPASLVERWVDGRRLLNAYGPTEASVCATIAYCSADNESPPIGRPIDNVQVYLLDPWMQPVPIGVTGELYLASVGLARGYLLRPEVTAQVFLPHPWSSRPGARLYRTGDLGRYLPNGQIEFVGRRDSQVKVRGYRIEVGEIETLLRHHPAIRDAVVLARSLEEADIPAQQAELHSLDRVLVAYLVSPQSFQEPLPSSSELRTFLLHQLPDYMVPSIYLWLDALPVSTNGKVDRRALPAPGVSRSDLDAQFVAPRTPLESYLVELWQSQLKLEQVGIHDNFFELGGDSIKAALTINKVQERFGTLVYAVALFDAPTIAQLATYLAQQYPDVVSQLFGASSLPAELSTSPLASAAQEPCIDEEQVQALRQIIAPLPPRPSHLASHRGKNPPAVFVLSPPRSGSTLLRVMLAGHPQLFAPPELELLSFQTLGQRLAAFSGRNAFWLEGLIRAIMELKSCDASTAQRLIADYEAQDLPTQQFYGLLQQWLGERLLVDKTPAYALDLAILQRAEDEFQQARYLHLLRHPRAMIRSFEEARLEQVFFRHPHSFSRRQLAELIWLVCQHNIIQFLRTVPPERQHVVVFEELVRSPQAVMEGICQFLGLPYHPAMIEPYQGQRMTDGIHPLSRMIGDVKFHSHQGIDTSVAQRWQEEPESVPLAELTWQLAAQLGYERPAPRQSALSTGPLLHITPRARDMQEPLPLSFAQERLWFLDQWEPGNAAYTMYSMLQLQGELHVEVLEHSLNEIVRRHEALRTTYQTINGQPAQIIARQLQLSLPMVDLCHLSPAQQEEAVQQLALAQIQSPFDLSQGPLLRTTLLRILPRQHIFLLTMHHSISDGWSIGIFNQELVTLYEAFSQNQPSPLPELPIQYADYILWQRQHLQGAVLQRQLAYWRTQLRGAPSLLALPTDRPRPTIQTFAGAAHQLTLSAELSAALRALSRREGVTLFTTLLAAFQALLTRYSQQNDISVGTYIAGRTHFQTESLIGFFINNLVLRLDLSGDPSFLVLLQRANQVVQGAYEHQEIPFEQLIQELQPERNPSHTPFFQVMLIYQNMPWHKPSLPGLTIQTFGLEERRSNFDVSLWVMDTSDQRLVINFEYNIDLFDLTTIQRWAAHFQNLLDCIVVEPDRRLSQLPLLSASERQQVLSEWNATATPFAHDSTIDQLVAAQAARTPDTIAVIFEEQQLTYAELDHLTEQLASTLQRLGVVPEVLVGLCLERSLEMIVALLAVLKAGGAYVPLDPTYPAERLAFIIQQAHLCLLLTQSRLVQRLPSDTSKLLCLDTDWSSIMRAGQAVRADHTANQLAYVIYTSGSTGEPKGVAVEHRSLVNFTQAAARLFAIRPAERVLQFASLSFDASAEEIYPCLTQGGTLLLRKETMLQSPTHFLDTCRDWAVTMLDLPTAYWHELAAADLDGSLVPATLRLLIIGGEQARSEPLANWQRRIGSRVALLNTYGPTETTVAVTAHPIRPAASQGAFEAATIGQPLANVELYVLDAAGQPVPVGIAGELYIGGAGLARGYLGRPELTAERFVPHPFTERPGARLYKTGDLVRWQSDGSLEYRGRVDRQVKLRGFRIELDEIEAVLLRHSAVHEAAVLLREDTPGDQRLVAYVVNEPTQPSSNSELRNFLQQHLPGYMLPASFVQLEALPLTPNGKLDRRALPAPQGLARASEREWEVVQTPTEELLADLWKQVLHVEQVGRHDHFFELGGHSLLATQLVARVRELFQVELPLRCVFDAPTLAAQTQAIESARSEQQQFPMPPLQPRTIQDGLPLSYAQQRLWFLHQLQPDSPSYNIPLAMRFTGTLDIAALHSSLLQIMQRQEVLRTTFITNEGRPRQVIAFQPAICLPVVDLSGLAEQEQDQLLPHLARQEAQRPFDLAQGPLLRTTLLRLTHKTHVCLLTMHHIITDAWSMGVFFRELTELYQASVRNMPSSLPELTIQYADYALWQRLWLEGAGEKVGSVQEHQLAYWRTHLEGAPPLLDLPTDHPRPQEQSSHGARFAFALSSDLVVRLRQLGQQEGATLFMVLLVAFGGLLARYSGQDDLVIGTPIANRRHEQVEALIGFFVNTLALRLSLAGQPGVREMLRRVRSVALDAYAHQDIPFERVVEALHPQRNLSHTPLFQAVFAWQNVATSSLNLPDVNVELMAIESGIARFDLTLTMQEYEQSVVGVLEYNRDIFEPATIERMVSHLGILLEGMVTHPEYPMAALPLLTAAERQQLLIGWNETRTAYPHDQGLMAIFEAQAQRTPDVIALVFEQQQLSYGELDARANQLAHVLQQQGVGPETLVGLFLERCPEQVIAILAILKAGGAYVPLDLSYPPERLSFMLADAHIPLLLIQKRLQERFSPTGVKLLCLDEQWSQISRQPQYAPRVPIGPEHLAYVIYTSGSTGTPKGVQVQQRSVLRLVCNTNYVPLNEQVRVLQLAPVSFDAATFELWGPLLHGGRCVLFPGELPAVQEIGEALQREQISTLWLTASLFNVVIDEAPQILAGLDHLLIGGEALSVSHVRRALEALPGVRIINGYGPTENTTFSCCEPITAPVAAEARSIPIGRPIANSQVYVLDPLGHPVPLGVAGELFVGGDGVARGYLNRPELTAERFVPHPFTGRPGQRLYRTGDLVRFLPDGRLEFLGRRDGQIKLRGFRIELGEIEAALRSHEAIREAVVLLREADGEKRLVAYLVAQPEGPELSLTELRHYLGERLPDYMVPAILVPLAALPLTPNGKLDRLALPEPESTQPELNEAYSAPQTEVERALAQIWASVLKLEQVGIHDNFFELGGDSILSIQIVARAHAAGLPLTPRHLFQHQTIAQLATVVDTAVMQPVAAEVVEGPISLLPIHHWFFDQQLPEPHHWNLAIMLQSKPELDPATFEQALHALLTHHDALRLRAQQQPDGWQLCYAEPSTDVPLLQADLSRLAESEQSRTLAVAASALQASLNLTNGPLLRAALFEMGSEQPGRLLIVIHHLAVDIVSWSILLEDLQTAYEHLRQGQPVHLPAKTTSVQQWARRLREYAQTAPVRQQLSYWLGQAWDQVAPLPVDFPAEPQANREDSARSIVVALSVAETQALLSEVPKAYHTQINDVLLTALVQAFAQWTGRSSLLVHLEGHGREDLFEDIDLSRTVGWFTSLIPLVLTLPQSEGPGEQLKSIKEQLRVMPQGGIGFGLLRYLSKEATLRQQLAALPQPEVAFNYGGRTGSALSTEGWFVPARESAGAIHSPRGGRSHLLEITGGILEGQFYLRWTYSEQLHQRPTIEQLARHYIEALQALITHCQSPEAGGYTPSDFPEAQLSQNALDTLLVRLFPAGSQTTNSAIEATYPLSPMQEGMLFHSLYTPQSTLYFEQVTYTLREPLDGPAFRAAWQQVLDQHPILRTLFVWEHLDRPMQVVRSQVVLPYQEHDWRHLSSEELAEQLHQWLQADRAQGFDFAQAPLLRINVIHLAEQRAHVTWSFHHLLLDGWSVSTLLSEVFACYQARLQGRYLTLPARRPYRDYITWLQHQDLRLAEQFWRQRLHGFSSPTPLGVDRPGTSPQGSSEDYRDYSFLLSAKTSEGLQTLARQQQVTLNTVMQGAWALLLSRYSGQSDIVFGATVSGRPPALTGVEAMVGLFINTLPVRVQLAPEQRLAPWLQHLQTQQAEARQYEYSPLVQVQGWSEVPRGQPLFESLLVFENYPISASASQARERLLTIEHVEAVEQTNYALTITVVPHAQTMIRLGYQGSRFEASAIERLAEHLQTILESFLSQPQQCLSQVAFLKQAEVQQLIFDWNATQTNYPHDQSLAHVFETQAQRTPHAIAVSYQDEQLTYQELGRQANQLAHYLQQHGVGTETLVGLYLERSVELVVAILAILKAGGAYVPLDLSYPQERLAFMLADAQIPLLLTHARLYTRFSTTGVKTLCLEEVWPALTQQPQYPPPSEVGPEQLAYVIYTSGSTGQPKGVLVQQRSILRLVCHTNYVPLDERIRLLQMAPTSFDAATFELWAPLLHGGRCVLFPGDLPSVQSLATVLQREQISMLWLTASLFNVVIDEAPQTLAGLAHLLIGGEALSVSHVRQALRLLPAVQIINGYGPTENTTFSCCEPIAAPLPADARSIPIGRPIANTQAYVLDPRGEPVPIGVAGELYLGGDGLARSYLNRPELTAERFVPHPFASQPGARLYRTGDLVRFLPDGRLEFLGRRDGQIKLRGFRIELGEIEAVLRSHEAIREAVALLHEEGGEKRLVAYLVTQPEEPELSLTALRSYLAQRLPDYMVPALFVLLDVLPLTPNGKLDRQALPAPAGFSAIPNADRTSPRTRIEEQLVQIWTSVLKVEQVGIHDNFFELGGDSILSIQIVARAHAAGLALTPRHLFQHQTIAQLAAAVGTAVMQPAEADAVEGPIPLLPIHHWFFEQCLAEPHHWNQAVLLQTHQTLEPAILAQALQAVVLHHDALRLRVQQSEGEQLLIAAPEAHIPFIQVDLSRIPQTEQRAALQMATSAMQASLDLADGPLMRAALFKPGTGQPERLFIVIHHLAVDIVSWSILLDDLHSTYEQIRQKQSLHFPAKTTSLRRWAHHLHDYTQSALVQEQLSYWLGQAWQQVTPLPVDFPASQQANREDSARSLVVALSAEETQALLSEVPRAYHTQINDVLLTALVQAFARWTGQPSLLIHLEGHGREDLFEGVGLSRTIGWFTSLIPLVLTLPQDEGPGESLKSIKEQLRAMPQGGIGFGLLRYLSQESAVREQLAALPRPEVSFNYAGRSIIPAQEGFFIPATESAGLSCSLKNQRSYVLEINGGIAQGQFYLQWTYSTKLHQHTTIEQLARHYLEALRALIAHCLLPDVGGYTPSDFPQARLSQRELDALLARLALPTGQPSSSAIEAIYPLSPMQEGMLFHSLYTPQSNAYFEQVAYTLREPLDGPAFRAAWQQVLDQHPILRTLFVWEHLPRPLQVVRSQLVLPYQEHDWRHLPSEEQSVHLQQWLQVDRAQGFDLAQAPLLRLTVHRLAQQRVHVTWSFHHLLLDGWSVSTTLGEVFSCYQALSQGRHLTLPARRPYRDYIAWLQHQDLRLAEQFWRQWLHGFTRATPLGVDRPGTSPQGSSEDYHYQQVQLSVEMTANLQTLARQQQVTLNTVMQGAWALLLSRYSGQSDIVFGTTVSGRPPALAGAEAMVGLFINTLPVRVQLAPEQRLAPWLQHLQTQQAEARQYEYSPLVQVQGWSEVPRGQPLFESLLVFENYPISASTAAVQESSLVIENVKAVEWTNYPLTIAVVPHTRMLIRISYISNRFADETIHRMLDHFQVLLEGMLTTPEQRLGNLPLLTAQERQQLLAARPLATTSTPPALCLHQIFEQQVAATPDAVAVVYEEKHLTYAELNARANCLAHALQRLGVGPEALVGLCLERSVEMIIAVTGILKAGGAYVPLDPASPAERLAFLLHDCRATILLGQQDFRQRLPALSIPLLCLDRDWPAISSESAANLELSLHADQLAYVIYTSGSTGIPKGVEVCHRHVTRLLTSTQPCFHFDQHDVWSLFHSIAFDFSVWELWGALLSGGRLIVVPFWLSRDPERFFDLLVSEQVTVLNQTPSAFRQLVPVATSPSQRDAALALRLVIFGGEALDLPSVRAWFAHFGELYPQLVNMYGITETTVHVSWLPLTQQWVHGELLSPIGQPLPDLQVYLLDRSGQPVPVGVTGEIYVGGAGVARGYLGRPELTAARFVPHPFVGTPTMNRGGTSASEPGARLYRSGDLARYTIEGQLEYLGRNDAQIKLRGFRIELGEIEATLHHHHSIEVAVVMLREDSPGDVRLVAYVTTNQEHPTTSGELRRHLQQRLPDYMVPSSLIVLESFPLTSNGKIDRGALPRPDQIQPEHKSSYVAPRTPIEERLASIWSQVLCREHIGVYDYFLDLGGSSLLATQIIARIRRTFQVELPLRSLLQTSTIAMLAEQIEAAQRAGQTAAIPSIKRLARTPLQTERHAR